MSKTQVRPPQALLRVQDLARAAAFYDRLPGFRAAEAGPHTARVTAPEGETLILQRAGTEPPPSLAAPAAGPGAWVYLHRRDLPELAERLRSAGFLPEGPAVTYPGYRQMLLPDPEGYVLAFWEELPVTDAEILDLYRSGPARLAEAVARLGEEGLEAARAPGKWTARQIVHHIVDADAETFHILRIALALPGTRIAPTIWDNDEWMRGLAGDRRAVEPAIALIAAARAWVLEALSHLPDGLEHTVVWPSGYTARVRDLLRQQGGHAVHHILQLEEIAQRLRKSSHGRL